ncbi:hypothetical protein SAMN05192534_11329 [Alteribacillus persepolensis]|uniref:NAD(P)-binding domain-containing protein n=1 Tax=Alteribacillus persepolensis TaxID=568899 RepID=A0A1G8FUR8_9BACI|nr:NAD(P)-dependent oxidoreductase [Alteribacillus persepolensis]SDH85883.1 hypothetical protein SAMN05192534_11329 [Alteribacillus persepolensis]
MKIGVVGATGKAGQLIVREALNRGHDVTAIVRDAAKVRESIPVIERDIFHIRTDDIAGFDAVVNSFGAPLGEEQPHVDAGHTLIDALQGTDTRLFVVGGAGSLYVDEEKTTRLIDTPAFPDAIKPTANGQGRNLEALQNTSSIRWTFLSPAAEFDPEGQRSGRYKKGKDHLITNNEGKSYISYADYAIAVVDEIENEEHINERFTVVSESN